MSPIYWSWRNIRGSLKRFWDNITKGWNDVDTWGLDVTLAKWAIPRLKRFKEVNNGIPATIMTKNDLNNACNWTEVEEQYYNRKWDWIIDQMIWSFEYITLDNFGPEEDELNRLIGPINKKYSSTRAYAYLDKKCARGLRFFSKYIRSIGW